MPRRRWHRLRPAGFPEVRSAPDHASGCPKLRLVSARQAAWAALAGHTGRGFDVSVDLAEDGVEGALVVVVPAGKAARWRVKVRLGGVGGSSRVALFGEVCRGVVWGGGMVRWW